MKRLHRLLSLLILFALLSTILPPNSAAARASEIIPTSAGPRQAPSRLHPASAPDRAVAPRTSSLPPSDFVPEPLRGDPVPPASPSQGSQFSVSAQSSLKKVLFYGPTAGGYAASTPGLDPTSEVWDEATWRDKETGDFAAFDAIVFGDQPECHGNESIWDTALETRDVWSPAVTGNVILIGTDPDLHADDIGLATAKRQAAASLVQQSVLFAASGSEAGPGLYVSLSCVYMNEETPAEVEFLKGIGTFVVRGSDNNDDVHIVANHPALAGLTDAGLSEWGQSTHEGFDSWRVGFTPIAIAENSVPIVYTAPDGTKGQPYILASDGELNTLPPDQECNCKDAPASGSATGNSANPVNTLTGNFWTDATDLAISGAGPALVWTRSYNSRMTTAVNAGLGSGWQHPYGARIIPTTVGEPGVLSVISPSGNRWRFWNLGNGTYKAFPGIFSTLTYSAGSNAPSTSLYTLTTQEQTKYIFDYANGGYRLRYVDDIQGRRVQLDYDTQGHLDLIFDTANTARKLDVTYNTAGTRIVSVSDGQGRSVGYEYTSLDDLWKVTDVMDKVTTYEYKGHLLTKITNPLQQVVEEIAYTTPVTEWLQIYNPALDLRFTPGGSTLDAWGNIYIAGSRVTYVDGVDDEIAGMVVKYSSSGELIWQVVYDNAGIYDGFGYITLDSAGNIYALGTTYNTTTGWDYLIAKVDKYGAIASGWPKTYAGTGNAVDSPYAIGVDAQDNIYIAGSSAYVGSSGGDFITLKYLANGTLSWVKYYDYTGFTTSWDDLRDMVVDKDGNVYVTGKSSNGSDQTNDIVTVKYDTSGTEKWVRRYNYTTANNSDEPHALALDGRGNLYVKGTSYSLSTKHDFILIKYTADNLGTEQWVRRYGTNDSDRAIGSSIAFDSEGSIYISGYLFHIAATPVYKYQLAVVKYSADGTKQWDKISAGPEGYNGATTDIVVDSIDNVTLLGQKGYAADSTKRNFSTIQYDRAGNILRSMTYNGSLNQNEYPGNINVNAAGDIYVVGNTWKLDPETGSYTSAVIKYPALSTSPVSDQTLQDGREIEFAYLKAPATVSTTPGWTTTFNGTANFDDTFVDMVRDAAGNLYVTGISGAGSSFATQKKGFLTVKYDKNGQKVWDRRYSVAAGTQPDTARGIVVDKAGNVYVTGSTHNGSDRDYLTIKYDAAGTFQWSKVYSGPGSYDNTYSVHNDDAGDIAVDNGGNVYVTGTSIGSLEGAYEIATIKYAPDGTQLWVKRYSRGLEVDTSGQVVVDPSGAIYVTGTSYGGSGPGYDILVIKYNPDGTQQWLTHQDIANEGDGPAALGVDQQGNLYVAGSGTFSGRGYDYVLLRLNPATGARIWMQSYNNAATSSNIASADYASGRHLGFDGYGNIYVTGYSGSQYAWSLLTIKYTPAGVREWLQYHPATDGSERIVDLAVDSANNIYVAGVASVEVGPQQYEHNLLTIQYDESGAEKRVMTYNGALNKDDTVGSALLDPAGNLYIAGSSQATANGSAYPYDGLLIKYPAYTQGGVLWPAGLTHGTVITTTGIDDLKTVRADFYDSRNTLRMTTINGQVVMRRTIDANFQPAINITGNGSSSALNYSSGGMPSSGTNPLGQNFTLTYNAYNRPLIFTDPLGRQDVYEYNGQGNVVKVTTGITDAFPLGFSTTYTYVDAPGTSIDESRWPQDVEGPDGIVTRFVYSTTVPGRVMSKIVGYGTSLAQTTSFEYDSFGRVFATTYNDGTSFERRDVTIYNDDNSIQETVINYQDGHFNPAGDLTQDIRTIYEYDDLGRPSITRLYVETGFERVDKNIYDASGRLEETIQNYKAGTIDPSKVDENIRTGYGYDGLGRRVRTTVGLGTTLERDDITVYDAQGHVAEVIRNYQDGVFAPDKPDEDVKTSYTYDGAGNQIEIVEHGLLGGNFDPALREFDAAFQRVTRIEYDAMDRPIRRILNYKDGLYNPVVPDEDVETLMRYTADSQVAGTRDALGRWTLYGYDELSRPVTTTLNYENGVPGTVAPANVGWATTSDTDIVSITRYDTLGRVNKTIENYDFATNGGVFQVTKPITNRVTLFEYDALNRTIATTSVYDPATQSDPNAKDTNIASATRYDAVGHVVAQQDALGRWVNIQYDILGRTTTTTQNCRKLVGAVYQPEPLECAAFDSTKTDQNIPSSTFYDILGRAYKHVDALGVVSQSFYDGLSRPFRQVRNYVQGGPSNATTNIETIQEYDILGRVVLATDALDVETSYDYDGLGRTSIATDAMGRETRYGYDGQGNQRWVLPPTGKLNVSFLDGMGRVVKTVENYQNGTVETGLNADPADRDLITETAYPGSSSTNILTVTNPLGIKTAYGSDLLDRPTWVKENVLPTGCAGGATDCNIVTQYRYDRAGNRVSITNALGKTRKFTYDAVDRQKTAVDALNKTTSWVYDKLGRVTLQDDPRGSTYDLSYGYDGVDRVNQISSTSIGTSISMAYNSMGFRTSLMDGTGTTTFVPDVLGRIKQVIMPSTEDVEYEYDARGQRTKLIYPDNSELVYGYYDDGALHTVTQSSTELASYLYDTAGRLQSVARNNGTTTSYGYDDVSRLKSQATTRNSDAVVLNQFQYDLDREGKRKVLNETLALTGPTWTQRFNGAANGADMMRDMTLDAAGNVYVTGSVTSSANGKNIITKKYNSSGVEVWSISYDGADHAADEGLAIAVDGSGNVYVTGYSTSNTTGKDIVTLKYAQNTGGTTVMQTWVKIKNGSGNSNDNGRDITFDSNGNAYITGDLYQTNKDLVTIKYASADGNQQWISIYAPSSNNGDDQGSKIVVDASNKVYVTGYKYNSNGSQILTIKYNQAPLSTAWEAIYNGPGNSVDEGLDLAVSATGDVFVAGESTGSGSGLDAVVVKYDASYTGSLPIWVYRYNYNLTSTDGGTALALLTDGTIFLTGYATTGTGKDLLTVKLTDNGSSVTEAWTRTYNGPSGTDDSGAALVVDGDKNVYIAGTSNTSTGADLTTVKYNSTGVRQWVQTYNGSGTLADSAAGIARDSQGSIYVGGSCCGTSTAQDMVVLKYVETRAITYGYDGLGRLTSASESPGTLYEYAYDKAGNRLTAKENTVEVAAWAYNDADQVTSKTVSGVSTSWSYDDAGNLLSDGATTFTYDGLNRLKTTVKGGVTTTNGYNGDGVLVSQQVGSTTTSFIQDFASPLTQILQEKTGTAVTRYLYGMDRLAVVSGGTRTWYGADAMGSVRQTLTDAAVPLNTINYDSWGTPQGNVTLPRFGYTGEMQDGATGLVNLRARWYQTGSGRFTARDPFEGFDHRPYSMHPYQYAYSNPALHRDPSGECVPDDVKEVAWDILDTVIWGGLLLDDDLADDGCDWLGWNPANWNWEDGKAYYDGPAGTIGKLIIMHFFPPASFIFGSENLYHSYVRYAENPTGCNLALVFLDGVMLGFSMKSITPGGGSTPAAVFATGGTSNIAIMTREELTALLRNGGIEWIALRSVSETEFTDPSGDSSDSSGTSGQDEKYKGMYLDDGKLYSTPRDYPIKLGHESTLGNSVPGINHHMWGDKGLVNIQKVYNNFMEKFKDMVQYVSHIHFNVDRIDFTSSWLDNYNLNKSRYTYQELDEIIITRPNYLNKTTFYRGGNELLLNEREQFIKSWRELRTGS